MESDRLVVLLSVVQIEDMLLECRSELSREGLLGEALLADDIDPKIMSVVLLDAPDLVESSEVPRCDLVKHGGLTLGLNLAGAADEEEMACGALCCIVVRRAEENASEDKDNAITS